MSTHAIVRLEQGENAQLYYRHYDGFAEEVRPLVKLVARGLRERNAPKRESMSFDDVREAVLRGLNLATRGFQAAAGHEDDERPSFVYLEDDMDEEVYENAEAFLDDLSYECGFRILIDDKGRVHVDGRLYGDY